MSFEVASGAPRELQDVAAPPYNHPWAQTTPKIHSTRTAQPLLWVYVSKAFSLWKDKGFWHCSTAEDWLNWPKRKGAKINIVSGLWTPSSILHTTLSSTFVVVKNLCHPNKCDLAEACNWGNKGAFFIQMPAVNWEAEGNRRCWRFSE